MLPELLDRIFPLLLYPRVLTWQRDERYVKTDLLSCSLVCRQWRHLTRRHIFHSTTFAFDRVSSAAPLPWIATAKGRENGKSLQQFIEFLERSPEVCKLIRRLNLVQYEGQSSRQGCVDRQTIYRILVLLPALQYVTLDSVAMDTVDLEPLACRIPYIGTLELRARAPDLWSREGTALRDVAAAVGIFTAIGTLRLAHCQPRADVSRLDGPAPDSNMRATALVQLLDFVDCWTGDVLRCFNVRDLRTLCIPSGSRASPKPLNLWPQVLSRDGLGKQLRVLVFHLEQSLDDGASRSPFLFS